MHTLTIEVEDKQFEKLANAGRSYLAYGECPQRAAEIQANAALTNILSGHPTPVLGPRVPERFAG